MKKYLLDVRRTDLLRIGLFYPGCTVDAPRKVNLVLIAQYQHLLLAEHTTSHRRQAEELYSQSTELQQSADLLVTSPLKRTLQTTIIGYRGLRARLESQNSPKVRNISECE